MHFAPENFARVPSTLVEAERKCGHESYLMTLYPSANLFHDEDICLHLPFVAKNYINHLKTLLNLKRSKASNVRLDPRNGIPVWRPSNRLSSILYHIRDRLWEPKIRKVLDSIHIETFDLLFLDGGMGFLRNGRIVQELKKKYGIKIGILYCGSDLRTRGMISLIDQLADYRFTVEFDHTLFYPDLKFIFFPYKLTTFPLPPPKKRSVIRIGHSPTNRPIKGTDIILQNLYRLKKYFSIEIVLIENMAYEKALSLKKSCDLFIDNVGQLGYGISGLEALAMGIPTAVELLPDFEKILGQHPFIKISKETFSQALIPFLKSEKLRKSVGEKGREWVKVNHDPVKISQSILELFSNTK